MFSRAERFVSQIEVCGIGRSDYDDVYFRERESLFRLRQHGNILVIVMNLRAVAGNNVSQTQSRHANEQWCVKSLAGESITQQRNIQRFGVLWPVFQMAISSKARAGAAGPERIVLASRKTIAYSPTAPKERGLERYSTRGDTPCVSSPVYFPSYFGPSDS